MFVVKIAVQSASLVGRFFQNEAKYFSLLVTEEGSQGVRTGAEIFLDQPDQFRQVSAADGFFNFLIEDSIGIPLPEIVALRRSRCGPQDAARRR